MNEARATEQMVRRPLGHSTRLLFGVFAAPFAWAVQLAVSYALAATSCFARGVAKAGSMVTGATHAAMIAVAIVCAAIAIAGLVVAMRERRLAREPHASQARHASRSRALADVGALCSALFLAAIVYSIVMLALSPHCPG
jgi:hypothetical protein